MTNQPSCKDRINEHWQNHLEMFELLRDVIHEEPLTPDQSEEFNNYFGYDPDDCDPWQVLNEYGLSLELTTDTRAAPIAEDFKQWVDEYGYDEKTAAQETGQAALNWCLSWGGPADYILIEYEGRGRRWGITRIFYSFQDWFDGAYIEITGADYDTMKDILDYFIEFESFFLA